MIRVVTGTPLKRDIGKARLADAYGEWEWPVVIRRFADSAVTNNEDDTFDFA